MKLSQIEYENMIHVIVIQCKRKASLHYYDRSNLIIKIFSFQFAEIVNELCNKSFEIGRCINEEIYHRIHFMTLDI